MNVWFHLTLLMWSLEGDESGSSDIPNSEDDRGVLSFLDLIYRTHFDREKNTYYCDLPRMLPIFTLVKN